MLGVMGCIEVSPERIRIGDSYSLDVRSAMDMPIVELLPDLVRRTKQLINCDRASIFVVSQDGSELTTILAENTEQIILQKDITSIAGECAVNGQPINLKRAYEHPSFNADNDRKTGYHTRSMLVLPIRKAMLGQEEGTANMSAPIGVVQVGPRHTHLSKLCFPR